MCIHIYGAAFITVFLKGINFNDCLNWFPNTCQKESGQNLSLLNIYIYIYMKDLCKCNNPANNIILVDVILAKNVSANNWLQFIHVV